MTGPATSLSSSFVVCHLNALMSDRDFSVTFLKIWYVEPVSYIVFAYFCINISSACVEVKHQYSRNKKMSYKIQTLGNYPEESVQHSEHGDSLESRIL
jgi:hypothetical protein